ncbi:MAG: ARMT1-like domain-containing protein [Planctomycetota bacterium]
MSHFCLLDDPDNYVAQDGNQFTKKSDRTYWLDHFANHFQETLAHALEQYGRTARKQIDAAGAQFAEALKTLRTKPDTIPGGTLNVLNLCRLRDRTLREHGLTDPFSHIKDRENASASELYPEVVRTLHSLEGRDRWLHLIRSVFAGNIFDLGSAATMHLAAEPTDFLAAMDQIKERPWCVDDFDRLAEDLPDSPPTRWSKAVVFIDNAGSDFILGVMPLVRELAFHGTKIVLAANELPSLNDITVDETIEVVRRLGGRDRELATLIQAGMFEVVSSGNDIPLIDLSEVSDELNEAAADAELVILEGMGRGIESNFNASFTVDTIWLAMLKDEWVANGMAAQLFDCVCKYVPKGDDR